MKIQSKLTEQLEIVYQDENFVVINKPHGLLVHRSKIADDVRVFAVQLLRDQIGQQVYPVHRLDRKTSGVLVFAKDAFSAAKMQERMQELGVEKRYLALVRGHFPDEVLVDYPLTKEDGKIQDAQTNFRCLDRFELNLAQGKFTTSRYSLIEAFPKTGRMHQIRKHLNHLRYPIIGDRPHGCNKQNKFFLEHWAMSTMLLHAQSLVIRHPFSNESLFLKSAMSEEFQRILAIMQAQNILIN